MTWGWKKQISEFSLSLAKEKPSPPKGPAALEELLSGAKREASRSRCFAAAMGSCPCRQPSTQAVCQRQARGHQESANKPQPISFWPQQKSSIAASTGRSQPDHSSSAGRKVKGSEDARSILTCTLKHQVPCSCCKCSNKSLVICTVISMLGSRRPFALTSNI